MLRSRTEGTGELLSSHVVHEGAAWQDELVDPGLKDPESIYVNWCDSIQ